jgi:hypothetical protein
MAEGQGQEDNDWQNTTRETKLTLAISLSAVHLCIKSPILTTIVPGIGVAGIYSPSRVLA